MSKHVDKTATPVGVVDDSSFTHSNHPAFYYEEMLADSVRMSRYRQAIQEVVKPGDVVADLGTGLGVLAMMAVQAGASHVYAIDVRPMVIPVTQHLVMKNGMQDRITVIHADARDCDLNCQVDVVLNELIGDFGMDENIVECVGNFCRRHLRPGGAILPESLNTFLVPVSYVNEYRGIWTHDCHGLDVSAVTEFDCRNEAEMRSLQFPPRELACPATIEAVDFSVLSTARPAVVTCEFCFYQPGPLQGLMGYFEANLTDTVKLASHPPYPGCHWQTWHWPVYPQQPVKAGEKLRCELTIPVNMIAQGWSLNWQLLQSPSGVSLTP